MESYHQLLTPENKILFAAAGAASFHEIIAEAEKSLQASIVVADSLHYILAMSGDLAEQLPEDSSWLTLIENGYAPPVADLAAIREENRPIPKPNTELIGDTISIHSDLVTKNGQFCTMFDILDQRAIVLKLAITLPQPMTTEQQKIALTLAAAIHMAYFRLGTSSGMDARGRYLIDLLEESGNAQNNLTELNDFALGGPFCLICFEISRLGIHNLSFLSAFADLSQEPDLLVTRYVETFVMLLNTRRDVKPLLARLDQFAREHTFPILLSRSYTNLHETYLHYQEISRTAVLATKFHGAQGVQRWNEYSLFLMFRQIQESGTADLYFHSDAVTLMKYDEKKNTQYVLTVYCYLIHNREAPVTADALFIHRNTLDKRLRKIETLIAADWRSVSYQLRMLYSLFCLLEQEDRVPFYPI